MSERQVFRVLYIAWLVAAGMLGLAIAGRHPYPFYTQLRWICCAAFIFSAFVFIYSAVHYYRVYENDPSARGPSATFLLVIGALFVSGAILFNPLIPFHFRRETWRLLDILSLGFIAVLVFACWSNLELPAIFTRWLKRVAWLVVAALAGYVLVSEGIRMYGRHFKATAKAEATIYEVDQEVANEGSDIYPEYAYYVGVYKFRVNGRLYGGRTPGDYQPGDVITVLYNPADPTQNREEQDDTDVRTFTVLALVAIVCSVSAVSELLKARRKRLLEKRALKEW